MCVAWDGLDEALRADFSHSYATDVRAPPKKQAKTSRSSTGKRNAQKVRCALFLHVVLPG